MVIGGLTEPVLKKLKVREPDASASSWQSLANAVHLYVAQVSHDDGSSDNQVFEEGLSYMDFQVPIISVHAPCAVKYSDCPGVR